MGRTKALIPVDGIPMARRVAAALEAGGAVDVRLVGGDAGELAPLGLPVIPDRFPGEGPLGGVLSALTEPPAETRTETHTETHTETRTETRTAAPLIQCDDGVRPATVEGHPRSEWVLVAPCDVPWLDAATVRALCAAARRAATADVVIAETDRRHYGLAVWNTSAAPRLLTMFHDGVRALHAATGVLDVVTVAVAERAVRNVNRPTDLATPD